MNECSLRTLVWVSALIVVVGLSGCHDAPPAAAADLVSKAPDVAASNVSAQPGVVIDEALHDRLGIEVVAVRESTGVTAMRGTAIVLDSAALVTALADVDAARSDATSARENYERLQRLFADDGNASRQAVEAAQSQWSAARARLVSAEARTRSDWGLPVATQQGTPAWMADLADGRATLLRAEFVGQLPVAAGHLDYALLGGASEAAALEVAYVGRSRAAAVAAVGSGVLLRTQGAAAEALRPGERLSVIASTRSTTVRPLVPAAAAFADGGQFWCYVQRSNGRYDRIPLAAIQRVADGYPVAEGIKAGDQVVVRGAPLLLSLERGSGAVADTE